MLVQVETDKKNGGGGGEVMICLILTGGFLVPYTMIISKRRFDGQEE